MPDCIALIVASGRGQRFGAGLPRQDFRRRPAAEAISAARRAGGVLVLPRALLELIRGSARCGPTVTPRTPAPPTPTPRRGLEPAELERVAVTRQERCALGLESCARPAAGLGARPTTARGPAPTDAASIDLVLDGLAAHAVALPAPSVTQTLKRVGVGPVSVHGRARRAYIARRTPQGFRVRHRYPRRTGRCGAPSRTDETAPSRPGGPAVRGPRGRRGDLEITVPPPRARRAPRSGALTPPDRLGLRCSSACCRRRPRAAGVRLPTPRPTGASERRRWPACDQSARAAWDTPRPRHPAAIFRRPMRAGRGA